MLFVFKKPSRNSAIFASGENFQSYVTIELGSIWSRFADNSENLSRNTKLEAVLRPTRFLIVKGCQVSFLPEIK